MVSGPENVLDEEYGRSAGRVLALCRRLLGSPSAAEDMAQEVLLRARRAWSSYDPSRPFSPWILRIATNACFDELRRKGRERRFFEPLDPADEVVASSRSDDDSPLNVLLRDEERRAVRAAIDELPARERALLSLRYEAELSYQDIAEATGLPPNHVGVLIHRAKKQLRATLAELRQGVTP